jgi:hypothetical protein
MREAARIAGLVWLVLMALAGIFLWIAETRTWVEPVSSNRGLIYLVSAAALPGVLLYRWGRGPYQRPVPTRERIARAYPPKTADEMGHVRRD